MSRMNKFVQPIAILQRQSGVEGINPQRVIMCLVRRLGTNVAGDDLRVTVDQGAGITVTTLNELVSQVLAGVGWNIGHRCWNVGGQPMDPGKAADGRGIVVHEGQGKRLGAGRQVTDRNRE